MLDLDELEAAVDRLTALLSDRHPGLVTWQAALSMAQRNLLTVILTPQEFNRLLADENSNEAE